MIVCCVCFIVSVLLSLSLVPLIRCYWCMETVVFVLQDYFRSEVSDHYSVDFLEKGRVLWCQSLFREFTLCYKIRIRLLGQVYHFDLLICHPYSFIGKFNPTHHFIISLDNIRTRNINPFIFMPSKFIEPKFIEPAVTLVFKPFH